MAERVPAFSKNLSLYFVGTVTPRLVNFLLLPFISVLFPSESYGILAITAVIISFYRTVLDLGMRSAVVRRYFDFKDEDESTVSVGSSVLGVAGIGLALTLILSYFSEPLANLLLGWAGATHHFRLAIWIGFLGSLDGVFLGVWRAKENAARFVSLQVMQSVLASVGAFVCAILFRERVDGYLFGQMVGLGLYLVVSIFISRRLFRLKFVFYDFLLTLRLGFPLVPHTLLAMGLEMFDRIVLKQKLSLSELGLYSFGSHFGIGVSAIVYAFNSTWAPHFMRHMKSANPESDFAPLLSKYVFYLGLLCCAIILLLPEALYLFFDHKFQEAWTTGCWQVLAYFFYGIYAPHNAVLFQFKQTRPVPLFTLTAFLVNVLSISFLIDAFGRVGASLSLLLAFFTLMVTSRMYSKHFYRLPFSLVAIGYASFGMLMAIFFNHWFVASLVWTICIKAMLLLVFGWGLLFLSKNRSFTSNADGRRL